MDNKTMALVSYIFPPIGWLISFFSYKGQEQNSLVSYHLRQSFGLFLTLVAYFIVYYILVIIFALISPTIGAIIAMVLYLGFLGIFVLMIIGIINGAKGEEKPLPLIGKMFEGKFNFIP